MSDLVALNKDWGIDGVVSFMNGAGGMPIVEIHNDLGKACIALQGAHVLSFQAKGEEPMIWMSDDASYQAGKSLRGGVPICWPWFGPHASDSSLPGHGPARATDWRPIASAMNSDGSTQISFELLQTEKIRAMCSHPLSVKLHVIVGSSLSLTLETTNLGDTSFTLGQALHTYFKVGDVRQAQVLGLEDCTYIDKMDASQRKQQQGAIDIRAETDRIYLRTGNRCDIVDPVLKRTIKITSEGSDSVVVWNPWIETAQKMGDLGADGYLNMLCVETSNAAEDMIMLAAGATHVLSANYQIETTGK